MQDRFTSSRPAQLQEQWLLSRRWSGWWRNISTSSFSKLEHVSQLSLYAQHWNRIRRENKATENASIPLLCMVLNCGSCLLNVDNGSILLFNHSSHLTNMLSITRKRDLRISLTSLNNWANSANVASIFRMSWCLSCTSLYAARESPYRVVEDNYVLEISLEDKMKWYTDCLGKYLVSTTVCIINNSWNLLWRCIRFNCARMSVK